MRVALGRRRGFFWCGVFCGIWVSFLSLLESFELLELLEEEGESEGELESEELELPE